MRTYTPGVLGLSLLVVGVESSSAVSDRRGRVTDLRAVGVGRGQHHDVGATSSSSSFGSPWNLHHVPRGGGIGSGGASKAASSSKPSKAPKPQVVLVSSTLASSPSPLLVRLKIGFYFGLWYALNIYYNIVNKKILNVLPLPWAVGSVQLGIGMLYVVLLWVLRLRKVPVLAPGASGALGAVGFWHCLGQLFSMVSLGAGPVSFTHIVKALEPFFSAGVSAFWLHQYMAWPVYASLVPVVGGVGYACLKEREFSWLSFWMAMGSNVAFAFRAVLSKQAMVLSQASKHLTSTNIFALVTVLGFLTSIPMAALAEGKIALNTWKEVTTDKVILKAVEVLKPALEEGGEPIVEKITEVIRTPAAAAPRALVKAIIISGLFHYLNNEVMYMALDNVHPITLAVGNTMKRVFIILASVIVFRNSISLQAGVGSAIGIGGVLLYSLTKQRYEAREKLEQAQQQAGSKGKSKKK